MGRKTFESMPRALPNRTNIVITRQSDYKAENIKVASSISDALSMPKMTLDPLLLVGARFIKSR